MAELLQLTPELKGIGFTSQRTRDRMVERLAKAGIKNKQVLNALSQLPRHFFVDEALAHRAYEDTALPLGLGQTLSQPYIVARMTELLLEAQPKRVLEIGTGSGFQCALLACLVDQVYSLERIEPLLRKARQRLQDLGLKNAQVSHADGQLGLASHAPFDGILVTAAPQEIPYELTEQLSEGGRLILPLGNEEQQLCVLDKQEGQLKRRNLEPVRFVPLLSGAN